MEYRSDLFRDGPNSPKLTGSNSPSIAFNASVSANLDEDCTEISELTESRRIQNRIAQDNYRKLPFLRMGGARQKKNAKTIPIGRKIKKRLEDLESEAVSPSALPDQIHAP